MAPVGERPVKLIDAFPNLRFFRPVFLTQAPGDDSRWYIGQKGSDDINTAFVYMFDNDPTVSNKRIFIDLNDRVDHRGEGGLLDMAFHPDFADNGEVFISYTKDGANTGTGVKLVYVLSRFNSTDGGSTLDPNSEAVILQVNASTVSHIGGGIGFGPDGYLYIGLGDGSIGLDNPHNRAQDTTSMSGAMLRIDVDSGTPYAIPSDNPFAGNPLCAADHSSEHSCPEIWAWGFRNPWRWSFDRQTGDVWLGDVGQDNYEEINVVRRGMNYGWNCREGTNAQLRKPAPNCGTTTDLVDPVSLYSHRESISITGGHVYRGDAIPWLTGRYLFADWRTPTLWALADDGKGGFTREELIENILVAGRSVNLVSFAQNDDNEIYALDYSRGANWWFPATWGRVLKLVGGGGRSSLPDLLSETGCVSRSEPGQPAAGLIPYSVRSSFWSDGAAKKRWLSIPDGAALAMKKRPQTPTGLTAWGKNRHISLNWDAPSDSTIIGYQFRVRSASDRYWSPWRDFGWRRTINRTVSNLTNGVLHRIQLRALSLAGASKIREILVVPQAAPDPTRFQSVKPPAMSDSRYGAREDTGIFDFPKGAVMMKHFRLDGRLIETRLFMRQLDGHWAGYSYEWNDEGTDANLVRGRKVKRFSGHDWIFPSRSQCMQCHNESAGFSLGFKVSQINSDLTYPSTLRVENQLAALQALGIFESPLAEPGELPALPDPADPAEPLSARARSYLDVNCSICHRPRKVNLMSLDLRYETPIDETGMLAVPAFSFGIEDARIVAPGEPNRSTLLIRMARSWNDHATAWNLDVPNWTFAMPPLASDVVDKAGAALIREWIESLEAADLK